VDFGDLVVVEIRGQVEPFLTVRLHIGHVDAVALASLLDNKSAVLAVDGLAVGGTVGVGCGKQGGEHNAGVGHAVGCPYVVENTLHAITDGGNIDISVAIVGAEVDEHDVGLFSSGM
jgi:hypothetical protein